MTAVRAAITQTTWTGDKASMPDKHEGFARDAAAQGAQVVCFQELFYGPYFGITQDRRYYRYAEPVDGPIVRRFAALAKELGAVMVLPIYEEAGTGVYYNTAVVVDADGTVLGSYRKHHIPHLDRFWEKFYFRPGNLGYPVFETAVGSIGVYICYDRHFPEGWRALGLNGAHMVFNPNATKPGLSNRLWEVEGPAAAVANGYFVLQPNRVGREDNEYGDLAVDFYGTSQVIDPRGEFVGERGSAEHEEILIRDLDMDLVQEMRDDWQFFRDRRPDSYGVIAAPSDAPLARFPPTTGDTMATTLITGGTVVNTTGTGAADVLIDGETIVAVLAPGSTLLGHDLAASVDTVVDASGKYVIPGGIDAHTHMEMPFGGTQASDTFETGTRAAAIGGTTSIVDFVVQYPEQNILEQYYAWQEKAAGNCAIDYGFHQILSDVQESSLTAMDELIAEGVTSFKLFMAYKGVFLPDDGQILRAFQKGADNGAMMMMHAENGAIIDVLVQQARDAGRTSPYVHGTTRPWQAEEEATHRAIMIADLTGAPLYVVHVSAKQAVEQIAAARDRGLNVFGETCPQYLYLSLEDQLGASSEEWGDFEGAKWVCSTPLRSKHEGHQHHMWQSLRTNDIQMVSTDHCPFCMKGQKDMGLGDFSKIPNGIGSVEHRMDLMYQGVVTGQITLPRWVELTSTTPARMFGMYGKKGVIQPGADGDVVVYDPNGHTSIGIGPGRSHHMNMDYSAWEGFEIDGRVDTVLSRGKVVAGGGEYLGRAGDGRYIPRGLSQYLV